MRSSIVRVVTVSCVALLAALLPAAAGAQTMWSVNRHTYQVVDDAVDYMEAAAAAEAAGGYLATMTSAAENAWLTSTFGVDALNIHWFGGYQLEGSSEPDGGWRWVTGEPWSYTNWRDGEPNDSDGEEVLSFEPNTSSDGATWNDSDADNTLRGYVIEWDGPSVPVLDPRGLAALAVLLAAVAVLALRTRG